MRERLEKLTESFRSELADAPDLKSLEETRVKYLGKKGEFTAILKGLKDLPPEERPSAGVLINETRDFFESALEAAKTGLSRKQLDAAIELEKIDVTLPPKRRETGRLHPLSQIIREITGIFIGMGYEVAEGPEIELTRYNFDALNIPADHPARDSQDSFYTTDGHVLRTQTSPVQARTMEAKKPPIRIIAPGRVFRADEVDATHSPVFHQLEGLVVDKGVTMAHLKGTLSVFLKELFGEETKLRFRPHHFPFTEPSAEVDVSCFACGGKGCRVCKDSGFIEILGCGMVHPRVLSMRGIDPEVYTGFAFGLGLERIAMQRFGISDMRLLYENDVKFLSQF
ncbi:MAG: phenylalanine--tRNA ligase subunit alpha [Clostridiales bacterium]|jgi:phenylalanyl-tRNA synthetase alpha chain|nr:phenylalanine--tRNA ligase subunit alpha [Clostridiales bacterium]